LQVEESGKGKCWIDFDKKWVGVLVAGKTMPLDDWF